MFRKIYADGKTKSFKFDISMNINITILTEKLCILLSLLQNFDYCYFHSVGEFHYTFFWQINAHLLIVLFKFSTLLCVLNFIDFVEDLSEVLFFKADLELVCLDYWLNSWQAWVYWLTCSDTRFLIVLLSHVHSFVSHCCRKIRSWKETDPCSQMGSHT